MVTLILGLAFIESLAIYSLVVNLILLFIWAGLFIYARDWMIRLHGRWFKLAPEMFDAMHYAGMGLYKLAIWMLLVIPYLVLRFCL